jgi:hypothetical protein
MTSSLIKTKSGLLLFGILCLAVGLATGIFVGMKRGIPFVTEKEQWTIGIFRGWSEHPLNPIVQGDEHKARPSGRLLVVEDRLYRYTMDINPSVGTHQVMAYEITDISPTGYVEMLVSEVPVLKASGSGWNQQAMHQIDPIQLSANEWIASVDGFGEYLLFGWDKYSG